LAEVSVIIFRRTEMKKWIHGSEGSDSLDFDQLVERIVSLTLVDDADANYAKHLHVFASESKNLQYQGFTREQLLQLPESELASIHDITLLRKLSKDKLTPKQQIEVHQANADNFVCKISDVKSMLKKLKSCHSFHILDTEKNQTFFDKIWNLGGEVTDRDAKNIINQLHVKDYSYSTYSYLDQNWNSLLAVFEFTGQYTFSAQDGNSEGVTISSMDVYIKIDIDKETRLGYAIMSFHDPEFKMPHPYKDYPIDKE